MRIQHNIMAMNAYRNYNNNTSALSKNLEKLSSGYKINRAGDDAAGLAISEKMRAQITGLEAAQKNVKDGTSLVKTAEGAMQEIHDMLNRMDYLATQSANGTYDNEVDRLNLQKEISSLKSEINRIADSANFNGIKLLDGVSGMGRLSTLPVEYETLSTTAGVTIGDITNGGGTKGEFTIDISKMLSEGDTIKIEGTSDGTTALGAGAGVTFTMNQTGTAATDFGGKTAEEQAKNLAAKMSVNGDIGGNFDVTVDGTKITLTAKAEGTSKVPSITKVSSTNDDVGLVAPVQTQGTGETASTTPHKSVFEIIGGGQTPAGALQKGDVLTFNFTDGYGRTLEAEVTVTDNMISPDAASSTQALVDALNKANFKDCADSTGVDESQLKVSDLFTLTANKQADGTTVSNGTIAVTAKYAGATVGGAVAKANKVTLDRGGQKHEIAAHVDTTTGGANGTANTAGTASKWVVSLEAAAADQKNFTVGDKVKFEGKLSNGSTFEVELTAGKDFEIGTDLKASMGKLNDALKSDKVNVTVTNADKSTATITGEDLFGTKGEFTTAVDNTTGALTVTNKFSGTASDITAITVTPLEAAAVESDKTLASPQTAAQSSLKLDDKLAYGAAVKVGDNVYEIVADARDTSSRNNTAVVVADPTDSKAVAKALADAIGKNEADYDVTYSNDGTVTMTSKEIGSDQKALEVSTPYGDKVKTASFTFDPKNVKEGSVLTFNGNTYEFVKKGNAAKEGNIAIELADPSKSSAKELGDAFAAVVKNGTATVDENGKVTLKGVETEDGKIADPVVTWENNLVLQIGDTADDFNQLSVKLSDMHTTALGIDGVDIGTQEGAQAAIDVIKDAINYVSGVRGDFGAIQNRLDHTANNLSVMAENIQDAESAIRDTDVAAEMMSYVKNNILVQSAQAMLAQANQVPQGVLQLLG